MESSCTHPGHLASATGGSAYVRCSVQNPGTENTKHRQTWKHSCTPGADVGREAGRERDSCFFHGPSLPSDTCVSIQPHVTHTKAEGGMRSAQNKLDGLKRLGWGGGVRGEISLC